MFSTGRGNFVDTIEEEKKINLYKKTYSLGTMKLTALIISGSIKHSEIKFSESPAKRIESLNFVSEVSIY